MIIDVNLHMRKGNVAMSRLRKINAGLLAVVLGLTGIGSSVPQMSLSAGAADVVVYDAQEQETFANRTIQDVADAYSAALYAGATYVNQDSSTWYTSVPSLENPYDAGAITEDTHTAMTEMTNFYRWLVGSNSLINTSQHSDQLQAGALVRNFDFNHSISETYKPADMSDELWTYGADCSHNILAAGFTPQGAITGWMNEGYNVDRETWTTIGHRAMMMQMTLSDIQYGFSGSVAIGDTVSYQNRKSVPFTAFPAPGYMPSGLVNPSGCAWSVELNSGVIEMYDEYEVKVTITNLTTGEVMERTADDETLRSSYGCIAFVQPLDYDGFSYSDSYEVVMTGLYDAETGNAAEVRYTVNFFDVADYAKTFVEKTEFRMEYGICPDMMNENDLNYVAAILPQEIPIRTESGQNFTVPVTGAWKVDMENSCFYNAGDASALPDRVTDRNGVLEYVTIPFVEKTGYTAIYDSLDIVPNRVKTGESVNLSVYRTNISTDTVHIFKLTEQEDGSYSAVKKFDSADHDDGTGEVCEGYTVESASAADAGMYLSVYFNQSWINGGFKTPVFVSNAVSMLHVEGIRGDVTQDGFISLGDLIALTKVLMGESSEGLESADCNDDGRVNVFDMVVMRDLIHDAV